MSTQDTAALIESVNKMTDTVAGKIGEIDSRTAENTEKVDLELARIQTKLPRIVITRNQVLDLDSETALPLGMSINSAVDVSLYLSVTSFNVKSAEQNELLAEFSSDMGVLFNKTAYYRRGFNVLKMSWSTKPSWLAFPHAADDPELNSIPVNTFLTLGAFVKVLSGSLSGSWANGNQLGKWVFCNSKMSPSGFGSYANLHPIPTSDTGEILVALPAAITGYIDSPLQWFPNVNLG
ncbi:hypothetical protein V6238_12000 [Marinomonas arenicola]|uniref:hypothetical protein n=1 Tax=Marinomonas arenicola TaxID=569601 RepID=UPI00311E15E2